MQAADLHRSLFSTVLLSQVLIHVMIWRFITCDSSYQALEVVNKTPAEILRLRGFEAEVHYAHTPDGYYIHLVRIKNPVADRVFKRPIIFNHGLLESSTIWLINSRDMAPAPFTLNCSPSSFNASSLNNRRESGPMMLANQGHDVWLMSMRGTDMSQLHDKWTSSDKEFWNYSLDDFGLIDIPTVVHFIQQKTGAPRVGYVGHSQATFAMFALLASRPSYADIIEPIIAVAPVAFVEHITSISRSLFVSASKLIINDKHGPFPPNAQLFRAGIFKYCHKEDETSIITKTACQIVEHLVSGRGHKWLQGYFNHLPYSSSLKVLRHFGHLIRNKKFQMYDYEENNFQIYGSNEAPSYPIEKIRSKSLCLISTKSDLLSTPRDIDKFRSKLTVPLHKDIFIDRDFNHFDLITSASSDKLVFEPILEIFDTFERRTGVCADTSWQT